ncbi:MAG TPA: class I SAM-dependent methyltransferase [Acidimicrobiales bacterium]|nr:class I SAM-dependent methyltransferase [Acidimicrobiales bacterium]
MNTNRLRYLVRKGRAERNGPQRYVARRWLFAPLERLGLHVTADHFYEPIPDTREVARTYRDVPRPLPGLDLRVDEVERRLVDLVETYGDDYRANVGRYGFKEPNPYLRGLDPVALYTLVRDRRPAVVVEVGQGFSTRVLLAALHQCAAETGVRHRLTSIDPHPRLGSLATDVPGVDVDIVASRLEDLEVGPYLEDCDLLFVDSSHVHKFGSDVAVEFASVYPRVAPGTLVHVHDIFTPYDYPLGWIVHERRFWNEQYLLEAFLTFNDAFEVHLPVHLLVRQSDALRKAVEAGFGDTIPYRGTSFYVRRR